MWGGSELREGSGVSVSEEGPQVGPDILIEGVLGVVGVCWRGSKWRRMFMLTSGWSRVLLFF